MEKTCTKCGESKLLSEYHKSGKYGRHAQCKLCVKVYKKAYIHLEAVKVKRKAYKQSEAGKAYMKSYEQTEKRKAYTKLLQYSSTHIAGIMAPFFNKKYK